MIEGRRRMRLIEGRVQGIRVLKEKGLKLKLSVLYHHDCYLCSCANNLQESTKKKAKNKKKNEKGEKKMKKKVIRN